MNGQPSLYRSDIRPLEFTAAVIIGGIGSTGLSAIHVHPLFSVTFALLIMGVLSYLRWRMASELKDFQSLEAFAEDIYLLGYLLTLAAFLGLIISAWFSSGAQLLSNETNLFNIAGLKLVTTVFGLGLMMIFRQTARRWAEEKEGESQAKFEEQQQLFSNAVARLNEGADQLTTKLDEVVRRFDPELLNPVAEWSNRAAGAFSIAASHLEALPASFLKGIQQLDALNTNLESVKTSAAELAGVLTAGTAQAANVLTTELGHATLAANGFGLSVAALKPAGESARDAIEKLGTQATKGELQFIEVGTSLHTTALELGKLERVLKKLIDLHTVDTSLPMNRLVEALESSAKSSTISTERIGTIKEGLDAVTTAGQEVAQRMQTHFGLPLAEHHRALTEVREQIARASEHLERAANQNDAVAKAGKSEATDTVKLITKLGELHGEMIHNNAHFKTLLSRLDGNHEPGQKTGFFGGLWGKR